VSIDTMSAGLGSIEGHLDTLATVAEGLKSLMIA
jgi:hypothetical protein